MNELLAFIDAARAGEADKHDGPLTKLRKKHRSDYLKYYQAHPEQTHKDQARQHNYQKVSSKTSDRANENWTGADMAAALSLQQPIMVSAQDAERTYAAIRQGRYRYFSRAGYTNSLLKGEADEYAALIRREDFTAEDIREHEDKWSEAFSTAAPTARIDPPRGEHRWVEWEIGMILDGSMSAKQLALKLGRSQGSIERKRMRVRRDTKAREG